MITEPGLYNMDCMVALKAPPRHPPLRTHPQGTHPSGHTPEAPTPQDTPLRLSP